MSSNNVHLVIVRHGQSEWNLKNTFTGWVDVSLTKNGINEAINVGKKLAPISFDAVFTSSLIRAQTTAVIALSYQDTSRSHYVVHDDERYSFHHVEQDSVPVIQSESLNERNYGDLQGQNKKEVAQKHGDEQVRIWRRSYDQPPLRGESLAMTKERVVPYFKEIILPHIQSGKKVLIVAHGNSLRSLLMEIEGHSPSDIMDVEIATGEPILFSYNKDEWTRITSGE